jgi:hypothetical protein
MEIKERRRSEQEEIARKSTSERVRVLKIPSVHIYPYYQSSLRLKGANEKKRFSKVKGIIFDVNYKIFCIHDSEEVLGIRFIRRYTKRQKFFVSCPATSAEK